MTNFRITHKYVTQAQILKSELSNLELTESKQTRTHIFKEKGFASNTKLISKMLI